MKEAPVSDQIVNEHIAEVAHGYRISQANRSEGHEVMSAVHEYKHTSWSENCSLCVQLKARADTAIAALEADLAIESKDADGAVDSVVAKVKWYHKELATAEAALVQQKRLTGASDNAIATLEHVADDLRTTLAERDRMLDDIGAGIVRLAQEAALTGHEERYDGLRAAARVVADLRARAEGGSEDE